MLVLLSPTANNQPFAHKTLRATYLYNLLELSTPKGSMPYSPLPLIACMTYFCMIGLFLL